MPDIPWQLAAACAAALVGAIGALWAAIWKKSAAFDDLIADSHARDKERAVIDTEAASAFRTVAEEVRRSTDASDELKSAVEKLVVMVETYMASTKTGEVG